MNHPSKEHDKTDRVRMRPAAVEDLAAINAVVEAAVMSWDLPERVKRLSLPVYRYDRHDLDAMGFMVAEDVGGGVVGIAAWDPDDATGPVAGDKGLLLHGLYVDPRWHGKGVGSRLFASVEDKARGLGRDGLLVKAQAGAREFFEHMGMRALAAVDEERDYANRYWLPLTSHGECRE
ncbi:MAG: GNAT family N-acetyltransferase [Gammaproteobacteria bacterium]|nr:GNAT family N-acetyltransferase [Gammaproteobacteria bacterium]